MGDDAVMSSTAERIRPGRSGILAAATRLFATHGVSGTSLQQIADAAGITKAAVYHHFPTKEEVVVVAVLAPALEGEPGHRPHRRRPRGPSGQRPRPPSPRRTRPSPTARAGPCSSRTQQIEEYVRNNPDHDELFDRCAMLLTGPDPTPGTGLQVSLFLSGLLGPAQDPSCADIDDDALRGHRPGRTPAPAGRRRRLTWRGVEPAARRAGSRP
uniref:Uncharacterized protein ORF3 n=1 Tax=Nocardioides simplex TaxID=2045 RepID=O08306_NOCSI|nr:hypothetical protein [Pimelobacter simplex]